jgi:hypothetical protein
MELESGSVGIDPSLVLIDGGGFRNSGRKSDIDFGWWVDPEEEAFARVTLTALVSERVDGVLTQSAGVSGLKDSDLLYVPEAYPVGNEGLLAELETFNEEKMMPAMREVELFAWIHLSLQGVESAVLSEEMNIFAPFVEINEERGNNVTWCEQRASLPKVLLDKVRKEISLYDSSSEVEKILRLRLCSLRWLEKNLKLNSALFHPIVFQRLMAMDFEALLFFYKKRFRELFGVDDLEPSLEEIRLEIGRVLSKREKRKDEVSKHSEGFKRLRLLLEIILDSKGLDNEPLERALEKIDANHLGHELLSISIKPLTIEKGPKKSYESVLCVELSSDVERSVFSVPFFSYQEDHDSLTGFQV